MSVDVANDLAGKPPAIVELTTNIVSAYVSNNRVSGEALPALINSVHASLSGLSDSMHVVEPPKPAVPISKSITNEYLICLEDGEKFKSLRRHLRTKYDLSPEGYREKWNLPFDYPMVAPSYARQRSILAKKMGLGQNKKAS